MAIRMNQPRTMPELLNLMTEKIRRLETVTAQQSALILELEARVEALEAP